MSENTTVASELASQYAAQVTGDLERNVKEQERISAEIADLQEQLANLQHDHSVLVNMQQALGVTPAQVLPTAASATVPAPRAKATDDRPKKATRAKKSTVAAVPATTKSKPKSQPKAKKAAAGKTPTKTAATVKATASKSTSPTLVELVRGHLAEQGEPRSAAEVAGSLGQAHPDRSFKTTVVRNTLENLVAKGQAQRSKQGSSVFYTAPDAAERTAQSPAEEPKPDQSQ